MGDHGGGTGQARAAHLRPGGTAGGIARFGKSPTREGSARNASTLNKLPLRTWSDEPLSTEPINDV